MARKLIVNADDLGLCSSVNKAIFDVYKAGNLSSATMMVGMPGTREAVEGLKHHPGLAVGLHFCITEGHALAGRSSITDTHGKFHDRGHLVSSIYRQQIDPADIRVEFSLQLERLHELGIRPSHVDSHQHVHMVPAVFNAMLPVFRDHDLPLRIVNPPLNDALAWLTRPKKTFKQWLNQRFSAGILSRFQGFTNDRLVSVHDLDEPGPYDPDTYAQLIASAPPDDFLEVMVHPYILGNDLLAMYSGSMESKQPFLDRCAAEYEALSGPPVFGGARLTNYNMR
jgi:chitin disaccharide deacetylase